MSGALYDLIMLANFCEVRLTGFGVARDGILAFSLTFFVAFTTLARKWGTDRPQSAEKFLF